MLRGMRVSTVEGLFASWWLTLTLGAIPQGFALYLDATPFVIGLLGSLQAVAGLFSLVGAFLVERRSERHLYVAFIAGGGRTLWILVAAAALWLSKPAALSLLLTVMGVSWAMLNLAQPAWTSWMNDLVPKDMRGRYFARRGVIVGLFSLVAGPLSGRFLDVGRETLGPSVAFALLFGAAGLFGIGNFLTFLRQPEPPYQRASEPPALNLEYFRAPLRDKPFARFLLVFALWVFAQSVAGPFFTVYMLETLRLSFFQVQLLNGIAGVVALIMMPAVGFLADKYGNKPIYVIAYGIVTTLPLFWALTRTDMPWLTWTLIVAVQILTGVVNAAMGLTQFNLMLALSRPDQTARYSAVWGTAVGVAGFLGPLMGGVIADATLNVNIPAGGFNIGAYKITFLVSAALRLAILPLLRSLTEAESTEVREVLGHMAASKPLASVRHLRRLRGPAQPQERARSAQALGRMKERLAVEELVAALNDPMLTVRRQAAIALGELGDARAVEPLLQKVRDPAAGSRVQAAVALGKIGDTRAVDPLIAALAADGGRDMAFVQAAVHALGRLRAPRATESLLEIAEAPHHPARATAIQSLGDMRAGEAADHLVEILESDEELDPQELSALGDALVKLGESDAIIPFLERLPEADTTLMRQDLAAHAGALIGPADEFYGWLSRDEYDREAALAQMLNGHARELRRHNRVSAARRAERAVEALTEGDPMALLRHLHIGAHKAAPAAAGPARDALEWLFAEARTRGLHPEETLLALYAYHILIRARLAED